MNNDMPRRHMRSIIFHLLYAADSFDYDVSLNSIIKNFEMGFGIRLSENSEILKKSQDIIEKRKYLDDKIKPFLDNWKFDRLGLCTKLILRLAFWELINTNIDSNVIINEAIELAKCFAEKDSYKFINGILDTAVKEELRH